MWLRGHGGDADALRELCEQARAAVEEFSVAVPRLIALSGQVQRATTALEGHDVKRRFFVPSDPGDTVALAR